MTAHSSMLSPSFAAASGHRSIRPASPSDAETISEINVDTWRTAYAGFLPSEFLASLSKIERAEGIRTRLSNGAASALLARENGLPAGFILFGPSRDPAAAVDEAELYAVYVRQEHEERGIGTALVRAAEDTLREKGFRRIVVWVIERNIHARHFYEKTGYVSDGKTMNLVLGGVLLKEARYARKTPLVDQDDSGDDITISPWTPDDAPALFEAVTDSAIELSKWMSWFQKDYSPEEAAARIRRNIEAFSTGEACEFAIRDATGRPIGACGLNGINRKNRFANLGYWVRTSHTRRGFASSAILQLVSWAFLHTDLVRLEVLAFVDNVASQRTAEKAGAAREGVLRSRIFHQNRPHDCVVYSFIRNRPPPPPRAIQPG